MRIDIAGTIRQYRILTHQFLIFLKHCCIESVEKIIPVMLVHPGVNLLFIIMIHRAHIYKGDKILQMQEIYNER